MVLFYMLISPFIVKAHSEFLEQLYPMFFLYNLKWRILNYMLLKPCSKTHKLLIEILRIIDNFNKKNC